MNKDKIVTGVLIEETTTYTFKEVCHRYHIPEELLIEIIEEGLFASQAADEEQMTLDQKSLQRLETAFRLHRDLNINLPGVALALDLLEEMEQMKEELEILRKHF